MEVDTAMILSWKEEPLSPATSWLEDQTDVWKLFDDDVAKQAVSERDPLGDLGKPGDWLPDSPSDSCDSPDISLQQRAQLASQLLQDLDEVLIKDEPFAEWYETKTDLPMFEELPSPTPHLHKDEALVGVASRSFAVLTTPSYPVLSTPTLPAPPAAVLVPLSAVQPPPPAESLQQLDHPTAVGLLMTAVPVQQEALVADTQTLLQEFECVFGRIEQSHGGALTPPQSPPHHQVPQPYNYVQQHPQQLESLLPHDQFTQQQQQLIAEVDELVRVRVQQAEWSASTAHAPPSPCTSSNSSGFSSDSPAPASPETDDPDWLPGGPDSPQQEEEAVEEPTDEQADAPGKAPRKRGSRRSGPYGGEDKKMRKKEQNKNAATRYRMKKKAEVEVILGEENGLKLKNEELQAKVTDLSQEIRYLKNLMRDMFRRKGLIK